MLVILSGFILGVITLGHFSVFSLTSSWVFAVLTALFAFVQHAQTSLGSAKHWRYIIIILSFICAFLFGASHAQVNLDKQLSYWQFSTQTITAKVKVEDISQSVGERVRQVVTFMPNKEQDSLGLPTKWLLTADLNSKDSNFRAVINDMQPGELWQITAQIHPPKGAAASGVFSVELWYLQMGVGAGARVLHAERVGTGTPTLRVGLQQHRLRLRNHINQLSEKNDTQDKAVLLGLLTGDRSLLNPKTKGLYEHFGISHLLAISGPHVLFAASIATWLLLKVLGLFPQSYRLLPKRTWILPLSLVVAFFYALLAGWDVPAQRTVLMFALTTFFLLANQKLKFWVILLSSASIILLIDPIAVLSAGFWLSFSAVGILLTLSRSQFLAPKQEINTGVLNINGPPKEQARLLQKWIHHFLSFAALQLLFFAAILPITLVFFGRVSLLTPIANLIAIPFLGFVVVPLNIFAYLLSFVSMGMADALWHALLWLLHGFHDVLIWLQGLSPSALLSLHLDKASLWFIALGVFFWLLPVDHFRWVSLPLVLALFAPRAMQEPLRMTVFDGIGGSVVLVQAKDGWQTKNLLYMSDIYPKQSDNSKVYEYERIILPQLFAAGVKHIDKLVLSLSTKQMTETALVNGLKQKFGIDQVFTNAEIENNLIHGEFSKDKLLFSSCQNGKSWQWGETDFQFLSPWQDVPVMGDDAACVLNIHLDKNFENTDNNQVFNTNDREKNKLDTHAKYNLKKSRSLNSLLLMGNANSLNQNMMMALCADMKTDVMMLPKQGNHTQSLEDVLIRSKPVFTFASAKVGGYKPLSSLQTLVALNENNIKSNALRDTGSIIYRFGVEENLRHIFRDKAPWLSVGVR